MTGGRAALGRRPCSAASWASDPAGIMAVATPLLSASGRFSALLSWPGALRRLSSLMRQRRR